MEESISLHSGLLPLREGAVQGVEEEGTEIEKTIDKKAMVQ